MPEKLVRDRIPEIMRETGSNPIVRVASESEFDLLLRGKVVEEAKELLVSGETDEIADILEALLELIKVRELTWEQIDEIRKTKASRRGGFARRFVLSQDEAET